MPILILKKVHGHGFGILWIRASRQDSLKQPYICLENNLHATTILFLYMHFSVSSCILNLILPLVLLRIFFYLDWMYIYIYIYIYIHIIHVCVCVCVCVCVWEREIERERQRQEIFARECHLHLTKCPHGRKTYMNSQYSFSVPHRLPQWVESKALSSPDWMRVLTGNVLSST